MKQVVLLNVTLAAALAAGCAPAGNKAAEAPQQPTVAASAADNATASRYRKLMAATPADSVARKWQPDWFKAYVQMLAGDRPATAEDLGVARVMVRNRVVFLGASGRPEPVPLVVHRARSAIRIDGRIDEAAWQAAAPVVDFFPMGKTTPTADRRTEARMLWDERFLYFAATCRDDSIEAPKLPRDGPVFAHDCVELFLLGHADAGTYWELNFSPSGSLLDARHCHRRPKRGAYNPFAATLEGLRFAKRLTGPAGKPNGYVVEAAIPLDQVPDWPGPARPGAKLYGLITRVDKTSPHTDLAASSPVRGQFHNLWDHSPMTLVD